MSALWNVLDVARRPQALQRQSRGQWQEFCAIDWDEERSEKVSAWVRYTQTQYAIAAYLDMLHLLTKDAYGTHIHTSVDERQQRWKEYLK